MSREQKEKKERKKEKEKEKRKRKRLTNNKVAQAHRSKQSISFRITATFMNDIRRDIYIYICQKINVRENKNKL